ncbi:hypothetical protein ANCDUO_12849 [Ancylostoma duodenale]|uniref:Uncharacterized protein n=1 Tax=Ancylostoma duodenale TaxID=51022 RepID=A0A0C2D4D1_9BILA|nr:hypothetical protein ANCDUO_12849 [Ancylostoma duodenale]
MVDVFPTQATAEARYIAIFGTRTRFVVMPNPKIFRETSRARASRDGRGVDDMTRPGDVDFHVLHSRIIRP